MATWKHLGEVTATYLESVGSLSYGWRYYGCRYWKGLGRVRLDSSPNLSLSKAKYRVAGLRSWKSLLFSFSQPNRFVQIRKLLYALLGPTEYFWTKAYAVHTCTLCTKTTILIDEMYNFKETNILKTIEWRTEIFQYSPKQNSIVYVSSYKASSLNTQSKLYCKTNLAFNTNVFLRHSNTLPKLIVNLQYGFTSVWAANLRNFFDWSWLQRIIIFRWSC